MRWGLLLGIPAALGSTLFLPIDREAPWRTELQQWCARSCEATAWEIAGALRVAATARAPTDRVGPTHCWQDHRLRWQLDEDHRIVVGCTGPDGVFGTTDDGEGTFRTRATRRR